MVKIEHEVTYEMVTRRLIEKAAYAAGAFSAEQVANVIAPFVVVRAHMASVEFGDDESRTITQAVEMLRDKEPCMFQGTIKKTIRPPDPPEPILNWEIDTWR